MDYVFPIYEQLWRRAESAGVWVHYGGWPDESLAGYFNPRDDEPFKQRPELAIRRPYCGSSSTTPRRDSTAPPPLPQPDILEELITLAHEYGHFCSFNGRTERTEYQLYDATVKRRDATWADEVNKLPEGLSKLERNERVRRQMFARLDDDARTRLIREETLAWTIGRDVLVELGFADFARYDATSEKHLHNHRWRLGMEDAWPGDL